MRKLFEKVREPFGRNRLLVLGHQIFSYERNPTYARRFSGLTEAEIRSVLEWQFAEAGNVYKLDLNNPRTLNEKLNWMKLYYRDPLMTKCADKVGVRDYVREKVGEQYLVPIIGVYDSPDEIDFAALPEKFALKVNWGSGQNIICSDKSKLDLARSRELLRRWMRPESNHYFNHFEWGYKDVVPKIVVEHYIENSGDLPDYKFFCYNGEPRNMFIVQNRALGHNRMTMTFYDIEKNRLPVERVYCATAPCTLPKQWDDMVHISRFLAQPFPFVRVDFYIEASGALKIGELTFYPGAGIEPFRPPEWDRRFGDMLQLPEKRP